MAKEQGPLDHAFVAALEKDGAFATFLTRRHT